MFTMISFYVPAIARETLTSNHSSATEVADMVVVKAEFAQDIVGVLPRRGYRANPRSRPVVGNGR
jgi:hypothetical protein